MAARRRTAPSPAAQRRRKVLADPAARRRRGWSSSGKKPRSGRRPRTPASLQPLAVLLDWDSPPQAAWDAADSLLQDANSPPLLLLTSRSDQVDFKTAIQAGSLIDKSECPAKLLEIASLTLESPDPEHRQRNAS